MEDVSFDEKRLKSILTSLLKCAECPVCLKTMKASFKVCERGHAVCLDCTTKLEKCPLCQGLFTLENLVCMKNMLEALPHLCCFSNAGCEEIVEPGNDHEMFCGFRPMICRYSRECSAKTSVIQFLEHQESHHPKWFVCKTESLTNNTWKPTPGCTSSGNTPVFIFNNLFWIVLLQDVPAKQLKIFFHATPIGKLEHDYYVSMKFEKDKFVYTYTLRAQVLSSCENKFEGNINKCNSDEEIKSLEEQDCMRIPVKELSNLIDDKGVLHYSYSFFRV